MKLSPQRVLAVLGVAAASLSAAGCTSGNGPSSDAASASGSSAARTSTSAATEPVAADVQVAADPAAQALMPAAVKSAGVLRMATDASVPPTEFVAPDGKTLVGSDIDIANALGTMLGVKVEITNIAFDTIIPALQAKRYDAGIAGFGDTKEREQVVDFVTYAQAGAQIYQRKDAATKATTLADLCGHSLAVQSGTNQLDLANAQSKQCTAGGGKGIDVKTFDTQDAVNLAVSNGRVDAGAADSPTVGYLVQQSGGALALAGEPFDQGIWGIAVPKDSGLTAPLLKAVQDLQAGGQYRQILEHWGVANQAIPSPAVNGATS